jgi:hypothetical protein
MTTPDAHGGTRRGRRVQRDKALRGLVPGEDRYRICAQQVPNATGHQFGYIKGIVHNREG